MSAKAPLVGILLAAVASGAAAQPQSAFAISPASLAAPSGEQALGLALSVTDPAHGASGSQRNTTGSTSAGSRQIVLSNPIDFKNGQGIRINHAGTPFAQAAPTALVIAPQGAPGSMRYWYSVAPLDYAGGVGPAVAFVSTTTGAATLSPNNYNLVSWSGSAPAYAVYGMASSEAPTSLPLLGITGGTSWRDMGGAAEKAPDWLPITTQTAALPDFLVTSVVRGAGSSSLTLATAASQTVPIGAFVTHDDTNAVQGAIDAAASGAHAVLIPASASCYPISSQLTVPDTLAVEIFGSGRSASCIQAEAVMISMFYKGATFTRGGRIMDLTLNGSGLAFYNLYFSGGADYHLERLNLYDVSTQANLRIGGGTNAQEFSISDVRTQNNWADGCASPSCYPFANLWMGGVNNNVVNFQGGEASYANIDEDPHGAGNHYSNVHGYNYPFYIPSTYNMVLAGTQSTSFGFEGDGASSADIFIAGYANVVEGSALQFDNITPTKGVLITSGVNGNVIHGNVIVGTTLANGVVQTGVSNLNSVCNNMVTGTQNGLATYSNLCNAGSRQ
jgi:hypothetical protein